MFVLRLLRDAFDGTCQGLEPCGHVCICIKCAPSVVGKNSCGFTFMLPTLCKAIRSAISSDPLTTAHPKDLDDLMIRVLFIFFLRGQCGE